MKLKLRDAVMWRSYSPVIGANVKQGIVVAHVSPKKNILSTFTRGIRHSGKLVDPLGKLVEGRTKKFLDVDSVSFKGLSDGGSRDKHSYLVAVDLGDGTAAIYWPRVGQIEPLI